MWIHLANAFIHRRCCCFPFLCCCGFLMEQKMKCSIVVGNAAAISEYVIIWKMVVVFFFAENCCYLSVVIFLHIYALRSGFHLFFFQPLSLTGGRLMKITSIIMIIIMCVSFYRTAERSNMVFLFVVGPSQRIFSFDFICFHLCVPLQTDNHKVNMHVWHMRAKICHSL